MNGALIKEEVKTATYRRKTIRRHKKETAIYMPRGERGLKDTNSADTSILDF